MLTSMRVALHLFLPLVLVLGCWTASIVERSQPDEARVSAPAVAPGAIAEAPDPAPVDEDSDPDPQPSVNGAAATSAARLTVDAGYPVTGWPPTAMPDSHHSDLPVRPPIA